MTAQPYMYARLTDGTTNIDFRLISNVGYMMVRDDWAPAIAPLRAGELGGRGPYEEVAEEFTIDIVGTSPADALTKLRTLNLLLEQATRFYRGENVAQVRFEYAPRGSTTLSDASPLKYAVYGRAPGDATSGQNHLIVDETFNGGLVGSVIRGVRVKFWRHGIGTQGSQSKSSVSTAAEGKVTISGFTADDVPSPTRISLSNFGYGNSTTYKFESAFIAIAEESEDLQIYNAAGLAPATDYTSVADAGANANGNILRFTPTATSERTTLTATISGLSVREHTVAIYANVRNNSSSVSYKMRLNVDPYSDRGTYTPYIVIPPNNGTAFPKWIYCGVVSLPPAGSFTLKVALTASATGSTLDIGRFVTLDIRNPCNSVLGVFKEASTSVFATTDLDIDHQLYTRPQPAIYPSLADYDKARSYQGNPFISTKATALYCVVMGTGSANSSFNYWRQSNSSGTVLSSVWSVTRERGYLTPP